MKKILTVLLKSDSGGGFRAVLSDTFGELYRSKRYASPSGAKDAFLTWAAETMNINKDQVKFVPNLLDP